MKYWPVRIETPEETVEVLLEATQDRAATLGMLLEACAGAGPVLITIGPEPVEAPAGPRGQVTALGDLVRRN